MVRDVLVRALVYTGFSFVISLASVAVLAVFLAYLPIGLVHYVMNRARSES